MISCKIVITISFYGKWMQSAEYDGKCTLGLSCSAELTKACIHAYEKLL